MGTYLQNLICHLRLTQIPLQFGTTVFSVIIPKILPLKKIFLFFNKQFSYCPNFYILISSTNKRTTHKSFCVQCSYSIYIFFLIVTFYKNKKDCEEYL